MKISLSELDEKRFGIKTAKATVGSEDKIGDLIDWCNSHKVVFLIARCSSDSFRPAQDMCLSGFYLTDCLVYYRNKLVTEAAPSLPDGYTWRFASPADAEAVERLARVVFAGYSGHYHTDPKLNKADADLVYSSWASNSCTSSQFSDAVLLICQDEEIVAFLTIKRIDSDTSEIILNGVSPLHQTKGLYASLVCLAENWAIQNETKYLIVSTQLTNIAVQKVWCRQGFEPLKSYYTFHKWFNR